MALLKMHRYRSPMVVACTPFVLVALLTACDQGPSSALSGLDPIAGKLIAEAKCANCHGMDGRGVTEKTPNLAAQPQKYLLKTLLSYRDQQRDHAPLQELISAMSEADIGNIATYYASMPVLEAIPLPLATTRSSQGAIIATICEDCHGPSGISATAGVPNLAGQQPAYLLSAALKYQIDERGHADVEKMLEGLAQVEIERMATYFAFQVSAVRKAPPFGDPAAGEPLSAACGECHGSHGVSNDPMVPSLAGQEPNYLVAAIQAYRDNKRQHEEMDPDISDQEIENIAAFYTVQHPESAGGAEGTLQELVAKCDRCHDPVSDVRKAQIPAIKGQRRDYLIKAMQAYSKDNQIDRTMHKMSSRYSDEVIEAMANYYAAQSN